MRQNYIKLAIILTTAAVVGGGYYYFSIYKPGKILTEWNTEYKTASKLYRQGKLKESIPAFLKLSEEAPTKAGEVQAKLKLAFDIFRRNDGGDRVQAVNIYKEIIADSSTPSYQRAIAISDLMDTYNGTHDNTFARNVIFKGEPFEQYLKEARELDYRNDVDYAMRRAYELAESIYPLSLAEFRIAGWYFGAIDSGRATKEQKVELLDKLEEWTLKGEANLPRTLRLKYETSTIGYIYMSDALARRALARFGKGDYSLAEQAFEKALETIVREGDIHAYILGTYIRFHYAALLADKYGKAKIDKITAILKPIYNTPPQFENYPSGFEEFLRNETASEHDTHGHKKDLIVLSKMVPEFKSYLDSKGIHY